MAMKEEELQSGKSHEHYGQEVHLALRHFLQVWSGARDLHLRRMRDNDFRLDTVQEAWNKVAAARKKETGTGFYLDANQHEKAVNTLKTTKDS